MASPELTAALRVGYDRSTLLQLAPGARRQLNQLGTSWGATAAVLAAPIAYTAWLIEKNWLLSVGVAAFTALLVFNLLRLIASGGGQAPTMRSSRDYRPPLVPALLLLGLALMLSQPAQLMVPSAASEELVSAHREQLIAVHHESQQALGVEIQSGFVGKLHDCEFILLRLRLIWQAPAQATLFTGLYCLLALFPLYLQHGVYLKAVQAYERARHQNAQVGIRRRLAECQQAVSAELRAFPDYQPQSDAQLWLAPERKLL